MHKTPTDAVQQTSKTNKLADKRHRYRQSDSQAGRRSQTERQKKNWPKSSSNRLPCCWSK